jgi:hypothetical protein
LLQDDGLTAVLNTIDEVCDAISIASDAIDQEGLILPVYEKMLTRVAMEIHNTMRKQEDVH